MRHAHVWHKSLKRVAPHQKRPIFTHKECVSRLNDYGIFSLCPSDGRHYLTHTCDTSHYSELRLTKRDVYSHTKRPIITSHTWVVFIVSLRRETQPHSHVWHTSGCVSRLNDYGMDRLYHIDWARDACLTRACDSTLVPNVNETVTDWTTTDVSHVCMTTGYVLRTHMPHPRLWLNSGPKCEWGGHRLDYRCVSRLHDYGICHSWYIP